jgi:(p)ppGpp synthase/HD superfamily hydrolase
MANDLNALAKRRIALRGWLQGAKYYRASEAMEWAAAYHQGTRKDGITPEFAHQIAIASHVRTFEASLLHPEECIIVAFLHDVREDYDVDDIVIRQIFGDLVADAVDAMTKVFRGVVRDEKAVFEAIGANPIASVVKLCDRIHNHDSMVGVFTPLKMASYIKETTDFFLPMQKRARRTFCSQEPVYEALGLVLRTQVDMLRALSHALLDN